MQRRTSTRARHSRSGPRRRRAPHHGREDAHGRAASGAPRAAAACQNGKRRYGTPPLGLSLQGLLRLCSRSASVLPALPEGLFAAAASSLTHPPQPSSAPLFRSSRCTAVTNSSADTPTPAKGPLLAPPHPCPGSVSRNTIPAVSKPRAPGLLLPHLAWLSRDSRSYFTPLVPTTTPMAHCCNSTFPLSFVTPLRAPERALSLD
jgi:hypothetical protein